MGSNYGSPTGAPLLEHRGAKKLSLEFNAGKVLAIKDYFVNNRPPQSLFFFFGKGAIYFFKARIKKLLYCFNVNGIVLTLLFFSFFY